MPKVLVLFHSRAGRTAAVAEAIARGAETVKFTEVEIRRIENLAPEPASVDDIESEPVRASLVKKYRTLESVDSLSQYDALIIGSPARYGAMSPEIESLLGRAEPLSRSGALSDKVGSAFGSLDVEGGPTTHVDAMLVALMHLGMIIVPPAGGGSSALGGDALASATQQGARVAKVAEWVRHAKSHEAHGHHH